MCWIQIWHAEDCRKIKGKQYQWIADHRGIWGQFYSIHFTIQVYGNWISKITREIWDWYLSNTHCVKINGWYLWIVLCFRCARELYFCIVFYKLNRVYYLLNSQWCLEFALSPGIIVFRCILLILTCSCISVIRCQMSLSLSWFLTHSQNLSNYFIDCHFVFIQ